MPDVALQYTQSVSQLGVGLAVALLYFVEYQVRICDRLAEALEGLKPQFDTLIAFDTRKMWFHVHSLRRSSNRLFYACLVTGAISFFWLLLSTCYPETQNPILPVLLTSILFASVLFYFVFKIVVECRIVERAYRRRIFGKASGFQKVKLPNPKGYNRSLKVTKQI